MTLVIALVFVGLGWALGLMSKRYWVGAATAGIFGLMILKEVEQFFYLVVLITGGAGGWLGAAQWWKSVRDIRFGVLSIILAVGIGVVYDIALTNQPGAIVGSAAVICTALVGVVWILLQERQAQERPADGEESKKAVV